MKNLLFHFTLTSAVKQIVSPALIAIRTVVSLSYKIIGEATSDTPKPPIFIFHNILSNKAQWEAMGKTIVNITRRLVVSVDLRNHGVSPHSSSHKYTHQANDVIALLDKLDVQQASLIGHSMGGRAAMCVALMAPDRVAGLLVVDISPVSSPQQYKENIPKILAAMKLIDLKKMKNLTAAIAEVKKHLKVSVAEETIMKDIISNLKLKSDGSIGWNCNLDVLIREYQNWVTFPSFLKRKRYSGPTLFIGGQHSDFLPYQQSKIIRKIWRNNYLNKRSAVDLAHKLYGPSVTKGTKHIIVLHGLLGFKRNWDAMCKKIAAATNASVIAADARNHGESPHNSSHTYQDLASDISQLLTKLSIAKAHIIGHSMGGRTGMVLALTEPSKVAGLIVVDISPVPKPLPINKNQFFQKLIDVMKSVDFRECDLAKARTVAKEKLLSSGLISNVEGAAYIIMNIGELPDKSIGWKCNLDALKQNFVNIATFPSEIAGKKYSGPTLFIAGSRSDFIPPSDLPGIKTFFPKAELKYIDNVGHNVHAEDPKAFFDMVHNFLAQNFK